MSMWNIFLGAIGIKSNGESSSEHEDGGAFTKPEVKKAAKKIQEKDLWNKFPIEDPDPYLVMQGIHHLLDPIDKFIPFLDRVKRQSEWKALGFNKEKGTGWDLSPAFPAINKQTREAIITGKRYTMYECNICALLDLGVKLDEFIEQAPGIIEYCIGYLEEKAGAIDKALELYNKARAIDPSKANFHITYFRLRLDHGDLSCVDEEFKIFENDIDSVVHCGRLEAWVLALIKGGQQDRAKEILGQVDQLLSEMVAGSRKPRFYQEQRTDFYLYKKTNSLPKIVKRFARRLGLQKAS